MARDRRAGAAPQAGCRRGANGALVCAKGRRVPCLRWPKTLTLGREQVPGQGHDLCKQRRKTPCSDRFALFPRSACQEDVPPPKGKCRRCFPDSWRAPPCCLQDAPDTGPCGGSESSERVTNHSAVATPGNTTTAGGRAAAEHCSQSPGANMAVVTSKQEKVKAVP